VSALRVLITNITLASRTGTETYVRDLAVRLLRRGHTPVVYTTDRGEVAEEVHRAGVPVVDDLDGLTNPPDVVHGHHHPETMTALLRFPGVPGVFFCHDSRAWHDAPPRFPRIRRYVAVDEACRDRLLFEHGIPQARVRVLLNWVDLERFTPRPALPPRPRRALLFSNYVGESPALDAVREACARTGLSLDVMGARAGAACPRPEEVLGRYDLVFAKARCALEALAVGAAVVLFDSTGAGPLVTAGELGRLRRLNLGRRALTEPISAEHLVREIGRYDAEDAAEVSRRVRAGAGLGEAVEELLGLYREVVAEQGRRRHAGAGEHRATARYLRRLMPFPEIRRLHEHVHRVEAERQRLEAERQRAEADRGRAEVERQRAEAECQRLQAEVRSAHSLAARLREELAAVHDSAAVRLRDRLVRVPLLPGCARWLARVLRAP
jgi:hypothetical protein